MGICYSHRADDYIPKDMYDVNLCQINNVSSLDFKKQRLRCKCIDVYDGDTITIIIPLNNTGYKQRCRLSGIDAPEIK